MRNEDKTREQLREERLERVEGRRAEDFRLPIDRLPLAYLRLDADYRVLEWNPAAERIFGYAREEAVGRGALDLILPLPVDPQVREVIRRIRAGDMDAHSVNENRTRDGRIITCEWFNTPLFDPAGRFAGAIALAQDVTEREQIREAQRWLAAIVASSDDAIISKTLDGIILSWNRGAERLYGYSAGEVLGRPISLLIPPGRTDELPRILEELRRGKAIDHFETVRQTKDGRLLDISLTISPIKDKDGRITAASTIARDITGRKRAERALETYAARLQALSRRLVEVHEQERRRLARELHDGICQTLTSLALAVETELAARPQTGTVGAGRTRALLEETLHQVRGLAADLRPTALDHLGLLPALLGLFERYTDRTAVRVQFRHEGLGRRFASTTETVAFRLVQEALANVARHAGVDEVAVRAWVQDGLLHLQVEDEGAGFDPEAALASGATAGLAGMREQVQLLGGRLTIHSAAGEGTQLLARLPPSP